MSLVAFLAGAFLWTFLEYVIHRFLGHERTQNPFGVEHVAHHSRGDYFAPAAKKIGAAAVFAAVLLPPGVLLGGTLGVAFVVGLLASWMAYEVLHRLEHVHSGFGAYGRWARRHHFYHHFHDPRVNHGVTTPLWDIVFGTYVRVDAPIRVPRKLQMRWLCDPATQDVWPALAGDYTLRGKARAA
ncbi:MAG: sterol desaturase family protein [Alphaproteobacteria bacterium]|nr:sterol desaturase family protein [Alphaproteobacteria bacterium]